MNDSRIAKRYAKALFNLADRQDMISAVDDDLKAITSAFTGSATYKDFASKPQTSKKDKKELLTKSLGDKVTSLTFDFMKFLIDKQRDDQLFHVQLEFQELKRQKEKLTDLLVESATEIDDDQKSQIIQKIQAKTGKTVEAKFVINPEMIGGVKVTFDNYVLDGSVRGSLEKMREKILYDLLKQV